MRKIRTISIDTGNRMMKTPNFIFSASHIEAGHLETNSDETLWFNGKKYSLVDTLFPHLTDKTESDRYFILSLFAIALELNRDEKLNRAKYLPHDIIRIRLLIGLPISHCANLSERYVEYFKRNGGLVKFEYEGRTFRIEIADVRCYPQGLAAAVSVFGKIKDTRVVNVIDVGGFTVDCARLVEMKPDMTKCLSFYSGVNNLFNNINVSVRSTGKTEIPVDVIEAVLRKDSKALHDASHARYTLITEAAKVHAISILERITNEGYDIEEDTTLFIGGGSALLKPHFEATKKVMRPLFIDDVHANAKGYEILYSAAAAKANDTCNAG